MFNVGDKVKLSSRVTELGYEFNEDDVFTVIEAEEYRLKINACREGRRIVIAEDEHRQDLARVIPALLIRVQENSRDPIDSML